MKAKQQQPKRSKWLTIRLTEAEYQQIEKLTQQTTCQSVSEYARKSVLGKPVVMRYRNQSLDDFLADMLQLRKDLNHIGNNFNQAVHRLHTLHSTPEIQHWILLNEQDKTEIFRRIETISNKITEAYTLWLRE
jgi:hypothetical protein